MLDEHHIRVLNCELQQLGRDTLLVVFTVLGCNQVMLVDQQFFEKVLVALELPLGGYGLNAVVDLLLADAVVVDDAQQVPISVSPELSLQLNLLLLVI